MKQFLQALINKNGLH